MSASIFWLCNYSQKTNVDEGFLDGGIFEMKIHLEFKKNEQIFNICV